MASMLGKATYLDEESEELWSSFVKDMNDFYERYNTIPVGDESLFPSTAELFAQGFKDGKTDKQNWDYIDAIYKDKFKITLDDGSRVKYVPSEHERGTGFYNRYAKDGDISHFLSVTDKGVKKYKSGAGASPIHEYFHYLDMIMNKAMGDIFGGAGMATRMAEYNKDGSLSEEELLAEWMKDEGTEHLDLDNPANKGLRTLLTNRLHHGGVVNVREDVGRFLSAMLNDEKFEEWRGKGIVTDYLSQPTEMLAYAAQPIVEETNAASKHLFGTDWNLEGLDKDLADSIATYVNSRYLESMGWTN